MIWNRFSRFFRFDVTFSEWIYLIKCVIGAVICYSIYYFLPQYPVYWAVVSVVLVFSPENNSQLAYDRIKSNFLGAGVGLLLYFIPLHTIALLGIGVALTIWFGIALKLDKTLRSALAALVIVLVEESAKRDWLIAIERVICVCLGCLVAMIITYVFSKIIRFSGVEGIIKK